MSKKEKGLRVKEARIKLGLTQGQLGEKIGVSQSAIGRIEKGLSSFKPSNLKKLNEEFGVNIEYIENGKGRVLLDKRGSIQGLSEIKLISGSVLAGLNESETRQDYEIKDTFFFPLGEDKDYYAIKVDGRSMEPRVKEGSIVVLEEMKEKSEFKDNRPYVIIFQGIAFLKRVSMIIGGENSGKFKIESDNEDKVQIASGDEISAWYKVTHVINQI